MTELLLVEKELKTLVILVLFIKKKNKNHINKKSFQ